MFGLKNNAWQWTSASRIFSSPRFLAGIALKILSFCWHQVQIPPSATEDTIQQLPLVPEEEIWPVLGEERPGALRETCLDSVVWLQTWMLSLWESDL